MTTKNLIAGLQILAPHYKRPDGYNVGAEHDVIYAYATKTPLSPEAVAQMVELGWIQEGQSESGEFVASDYDPEESWSAYT